MKRFSIFILAAIVLLILVRSAYAFQPNTVRLHKGAVFPKLSGQTITGRAVSLSGATTDKPIVLVFSFSRTASKDAQQWNDRLAKDFPNTIYAFGVIQLESAPKILRRLAVSGIKSSMPVSAQNRAIVLYRDEELWKQRLAVTDESRAYVVALDQPGTIYWLNSGVFSDAAYATLKNKIETLLQARPSSRTASSQSEHVP